MELELLNSLQMGLIYSFVTIAVYLTFRVIDFSDLTVDGSFMLGSAITATLIASGFDPFAGTIAGFLGGVMSGVVTAYLNVRWKIQSLLASILVMISLYSVNLRIMGTPNISLVDNMGIFGLFPTTPLIVTTILIGGVVTLLAWLFATDYGLSIKSAGMNPRMSRAYGINTHRATYVILALSNGLVAFAGSLFTQAYGFSDISMGTGVLTIGLASVIIGERIFGARDITLALIACVLGSVFFRFVISCALNSTGLGLKSSDLNMITSLLIVGTIIFSIINKRPSFLK